jgi:hypothetical protein
MLNADFFTAVNGQHASKKTKLLHQAPDISLEALTPVGPLASPVASQMSNMGNPTKIIKIITNRDRGRKTKAVKVSIYFDILVVYVFLHLYLGIAMYTNLCCIFDSFPLQVKTFFLYTIARMITPSILAFFFS